MTNQITRCFSSFFWAILFDVIFTTTVPVLVEERSSIIFLVYLSQNFLGHDKLSYPFTYLHSFS